MENERKSTGVNEEPIPKKCKPNEKSQKRREADNLQQRQRTANETKVLKQIREADRKLRKKRTGSFSNAGKFEGSKINGIDIMFASTSQADELVFMEESCSRQCMAMSLCFLIRCQMIQDWNRRELNAILILGDKLYNDLVKRCREQSVRVPSDGYLNLIHVQVLTDNLELFGQQWQLGFNDNSVRLKFLKFCFIS